MAANISPTMSVALWSLCAVFFTSFVAFVAYACGQAGRAPGPNRCIHTKYANRKPRVPPPELPPSLVPKPVAVQLQAARRTIATKDQHIENLRYRIHNDEARREREHQRALREMAMKMEDAELAKKESKSLWDELQREKLKSLERWVEIDKLKRGGEHQRLSKERDAARRDAHQAEISEKEAQRKLEKALRKAESKGKDAEMARKKAREAELAKAIVEEKHGSLERDLKKTKEAAEQARLDDAETIKQLKSRLQEIRAERDRLATRNEEVEAALRFASESNEVEQLKVENGVTSGKNLELQRLLENTSKQNEELRMMLEAASKKSEEPAAVQSGPDHRIEEAEAVQKGLLERIESLEAEKAHLMQQAQYLQNNASDTEAMRQQNGVLSETIEEMKRQYHLDMDGVKAEAEALAGQVASQVTANLEIHSALGEAQRENEQLKHQLGQAQQQVAEWSQKSGRKLAQPRRRMNVGMAPIPANDEYEHLPRKPPPGYHHAAESKYLHQQPQPQSNGRISQPNAQAPTFGDEEFPDLAKLLQSDDQELKQTYGNIPLETPNSIPQDTLAGQYDGFGCDLGSQSAYPPPSENSQTSSPYYHMGGQQSFQPADPLPPTTTNIPGLNPIPGQGPNLQPTGRASTGGEEPVQFPDLTNFLAQVAEEEKEMYGDLNYDWSKVDPSLLQ